MRTLCEQGRRDQLLITIPVSRSQQILLGYINHVDDVINCDAALGYVCREDYLETMNIGYSTQTI